MAQSVMLISSLQNSRVKHVVRLNSRRYRDAQQQTIVEGLREADRALGAGIVPQEAYICTELLQGDDARKVVGKLQQLGHEGATKLFQVTLPVFAKMAYRGSSGGIILIIAYQESSTEALLGAPSPFLVVIDGAEKPGNVGAILRTADAAGVDGLVISESGTSGTDIHNPNVIRASLGTIFSVPVISMPAAEAINWLKKAGIKIAASTPRARDVYMDTSLTGPIAVVMGSEALGLDEAWLETADLQVRIPMYGVVDSLNLSVSTALILYEVVRQRNAASNNL